MKTETEIIEITLPAAELKEALPGLNKVICKARVLPVLQCVRVTRKEGVTTLSASDLDSFVTYTPKESEPGPDTDFLVPIEHLNKAVKSSSSKSFITMAAEGEDKVKFSYVIGDNRVVQSFHTLPIADFPPQPEVNRPGTLLDAGFGLAMKQAMECCSTDPTRRIINGACLDVRDAKKHYVVGVNGRCLIASNSFCFDLQKSIVIPNSKFINWPGFLNEESVELSVEPEVEFKPAKDGKPAQEGKPAIIKLATPRWSLVTTGIDGEYPNWKQCCPTITAAKWTKVTLSEAVVKQLLLVIPSLPGDEHINSPVRLKISEDKLVVGGMNKESEEWTNVPMDVETVGKPVTIDLNRNFLLSALKFGLSEIAIEDELSPIVMSKPGKKMVIMPMRSIDGPAQATPAQEQPTSTPESKQEPEATVTAPSTTEAESQPAKTLVEQIEGIKDGLKNILRSISTLVDNVRVAEKEKRLTEKEVEAVRNKLRQIQNVSI